MRKAIYTLLTSKKTIATVTGLIVVGVAKLGLELPEDLVGYIAKAFLMLVGGITVKDYAIEHNMTDRPDERET